MRKICCFAGHGKIFYDDEIRTQICRTIEAVIKEEEITEFWVGNYGSFDRLSAGCVREVKKHYPYIKLYLVIPYLTAEINRDKTFFEKNYDGILIAEIPERTPKRLGIIKCDEYMADKAMCLICYVATQAGGAAKTLRYAEKKRIQIYNLAEKAVLKK